MERNVENIDPGHKYYQNQPPEVFYQKGPGRFPGIAGNVRNHGNDGKFHQSHKILNQI